MAIGSQTTPSIDTPAICLARVAQVRRRWSRLRQCWAWSVLAVCICAVIAAAIVLDWRLRGGHPLRFACLGALAASVAWCLWRHVIPCGKGLSSDGAALLIEQARSGLDGRLITAVQLQSSAFRSRSNISEGLYGQVRERAEQQAETLDVTEVLPARPVMRRCAVVWVAIGVCLLPAAINPTLASVGLCRLFVPWSDLTWPRRTTIELARAAGETLRVVRGGTFVLDGRVSGVIPSTGILHVQSGPNESDRRPAVHIAANAAAAAAFDIGPDGRFTVRYRPVMCDLGVMLEIGDASSPTLRVKMVTPPQITTIQVECIAPEYTHLPPKQLTEGNVQAIYQSEVRLRVTANKPVEKAVLEWEGSPPLLMQPVDKVVRDVRFRVEMSGTYRVRLTDSFGFVNEQPVAYRVEMIDNAYPRIEKAAPAIDKRVTARATIPIAAEIVDDFQVAEAWLCYRTAKDAPAVRVSVPLDDSGRRASLQYAWVLDKLPLKPGASLEYWLEARDRGEHATKADWPVSRTRRLEIVGEAELTAQLDEQLKQLLERLTQLESLQAECADAVDRVARAVSSRPAAASQPGAAAERALAEKWRQDRIAHLAAQIAERLGDLADDFAISHIGDPARAQRLRRTADALGRIAGADMPSIVLALNQAAAALQDRPSHWPSASRPSTEKHNE